VLNFGIVKPGTTLYFPFDSFALATGASITMTTLATSDILVYKDGGVTQRASASGYTLLDTDGIDFDAVTGIHGFSISLADDTTAGFWAAGSKYFVAVQTITIDSASVSFVAGAFEIGYPNAVINTTIATWASTTSFTLTNGPAENNALNNMFVILHDIASAVQMGYAVISAYTGATKTVTLAAATTFTIATSDNISVMGPAPLQPTVAARTLDVTSTGEAGIDWANVGAPTTTVGLTNTTVGVLTTYTGNTVQTGDSFARLGAPAAASVSADILAIDNLVDDLESRVGTPSDLGGGATVAANLADIEGQTDDIGVAGAGLTAVPWNAAWDAEVQSEVDDAINTAISELGVATPTATPTIRTAIMLMYMALRNKLVVQTSGTDAIEIYNDAGTKICAKTITDDGADYTENEMA
jgi:hypothetical protein